MSERYYRNDKTGKRAKLTIFSAAFAKSKGTSRYYVALFNRDELEAKTENQWYEKKLIHAINDCKAHINNQTGE